MATNGSSTSTSTITTTTTATEAAATSLLMDYTYPLHEEHAGLAFNILYYGVVIPVSYLGNLFTYVIVCKILVHRNSTSDVLVGGLALNDVLTATIVFTPSLISAARGRYFSSRVMCEFSSVTTVWYIYTTFAMLVLISAERWLAITRPFAYKRLLLTGFKLKFVMAVLGFSCLMLASLPLIRYPVVLKAGWYCAPATITYPIPPEPTITIHIPTTTTTATPLDIIPTITNITGCATTTTTATVAAAAAAAAVIPSGPFNAVPELSPVPETMYIKLVYMVSGITMMLACNVSIAYTLNRRPFGDAASREVDRKFARIMGVVAVLFLFTWLPNLMAQAACLAKSPVCPMFEFWAMRIVNIGVAVNPFVYGVMKTTYRRGYLYLVRVSLHYLTCTFLPRPTYGEEIFDLRERVRAVRASGRSVSSGQTTSPPTRNFTYTVTKHALFYATTCHNSDRSELSETTICDDEKDSVSIVDEKPHMEKHVPKTQGPETHGTCSLGEPERKICF